MADTIRFGSLFSGIGGIDLGLERAGMECAWQVEIDPYAQKVLEKHWPRVKRYGDIKECGATNLDPVDLICGGFPCQDISYAGKGAGIEGERSGLWKEFYRIICELRPRYILVENVSALLRRGIDVVLGDLASCGYDAEWESLPAAAFGAPHRRDRIFIVAYAPSVFGSTVQRDESDRVLSANVAYAKSADGQSLSTERRSSPQGRREAETPRSRGGKADVAHTNGKSAERPTEPRQERNPWTIEPDVGRVANGVPARVDRLRCLGNAVVPQVAEWVGRQIVRMDNERNT